MARCTTCNLSWYDEHDPAGALGCPACETKRLRAELVKVYDAVGSSKVRCPRCGGTWFVPDQFHGDPRFDCPHCEAATPTEET